MLTYRIKMLILPFLLLTLSLSLADQASTKERTRGLAEPSGLPSLKYLNPYFRHSSLSFIGNETSNLWKIPSSVDWRNANGKNLVGDAKDQGSCGSCWAFSAVGSLESAYALTYDTSKPVISTQQVLDCEGSGTSSNCAGGLPVEAFNFMAGLSGRNGLMDESVYPYTGLKSKPKCSGKYKGTYGISMYEITELFGWFGNLLALQSQPIVVLLQADHPTFQNFQGTGIYDNAGCYSNIVNHAVLLVGYNLNNPIPYWVIKNSWGSGWGDNGFMKIAIRGGEGVCGVQSNPGMFPVVSGNQPCSGKINPCGGGTCIPNLKKNTYTCSCPSGFIAVKNLDKTQSCAIINACGYSSFNPCNFGTCVNDMAGGYSCICPFGFSEGQRCDGKPTCIPNKNSGKSYVVKKGASCAMVLAQYRLSETKFKMLNKGQSCKSLKSGSTLNVNTNDSCSLYFSSRKNYSCSSVLRIFSFSINQFLLLNPSIDCNQQIPSFVQVCVKSGIQTDIPTGIQSYAVKPGDSCQSIIDSFKISASYFYTLNPGIFCDGLIPNTGYATPGQQVFVSGVVASTTCKFRTYVVKKGDTCARIIYLYFNKSVTLFKNYNGNAACTASWLYVGRKICRP